MFRGEIQRPLPQDGQHEVREGGAERRPRIFDLANEYASDLLHRRQDAIQINRTAQPALLPALPHEAHTSLTLRRVELYSTTFRGDTYREVILTDATEDTSTVFLDRDGKVKRFSGPMLLLPRTIHRHIANVPVDVFDESLAMERTIETEILQASMDQDRTNLVHTLSHNEVIATLKNVNANIADPVAVTLAAAEEDRAQDADTAAAFNAFMDGYGGYTTRTGVGLRRGNVQYSVTRIEAPETPTRISFIRRESTHNDVHVSTESWLFTENPQQSTHFVNDKSTEQKELTLNLLRGLTELATL